jgi:hypothetical protein
VENKESRELSLYFDATVVSEEYPLEQHKKDDREKYESKFFRFALNLDTLNGVI